MISGFNLIQNSINTQSTTQSSHGFQFIQNSQTQTPQQQLLQSMPNSISRITTSYPIEEQEEQEEEYNECNYNSREVTPNYASTNSNNPNNYITLPFANATYLTIITAKLTYQPISGMYNYLTVVNASNIYLSMSMLPILIYKLWMHQITTYKSLTHQTFI